MPPKSGKMTPKSVKMEPESTKIELIEGGILELPELTEEYEESIK